MALTLQQLAQRINATIEGDGSKSIIGCAPIDTAGPDQVTFLANTKYTRYLKTTKAAAVLIGPSTKSPEGLTRLVCADPYFGFRNAMIELHGHRQHARPFSGRGNGISPRAEISPDAVIGEGTIIHPFVAIDSGVRVGRNCVLYPGVSLGPNARVGDECLLYPNVVVYDHCVLGDRVILHGNTVIGSDGFGYATHDGAHHKIPQNGIVILGDDVELGAGCAIERGAIGETHIGKGTKFADLISIGHGTTIGEHCLFVSLCGVSGSVDVGNYVVMGGQAGVVGHLRIGNGVQIAAKAAVVGDIPDGAQVAGVPAISHTKAKKNALAAADLYELVKRVRRLERQVEKLANDDQA